MALPNVGLALCSAGVSACQNILVYSYCVSQQWIKEDCSTLCWSGSFFLRKANPQHDLRNSVVKGVVASVDSGNCCCSITRMWSPHLEKALEDGMWSEDVWILARDLSSVAWVHDTISCSLLEFTHPNRRNHGVGCRRWTRGSCPFI